MTERTAVQAEVVETLQDMTRGWTHDDWFERMRRDWLRDKAGTIASALVSAELFKKIDGDYLLENIEIPTDSLLITDDMIDDILYQRRARDD